MVSLTEKITPSLNVLLVEDNIGEVVLITEVFKASKRPIHVTRAKDGVEALRFLKGEEHFKKPSHPDLVLLDLNIPKKNGWEVLQEIKAHSRLKDIPVVILTSSKLDSDLQRAYECQANFFIVKPSDLDQLFMAMRYVEDVWLRKSHPEDGGGQMA